MYIYRYILGYFSLRSEDQHWFGNFHLTNSIMNPNNNRICIQWIWRNGFVHLQYDWLKRTQWKRRWSKFTIRFIWLNSYFSFRGWQIVFITLTERRGHRNFRVYSVKAFCVNEIRGVQVFVPQLWHLLENFLLFFCEINRFSEKKQISWIISPI